MKNSIIFFVELIISFLPFIVFAFLNNKVNVKKNVRNRQYLMPFIAIVYSALLLIFLDRLANLITKLFLKIASLFERISLDFVADFIRDKYFNWGIILELILFNTLALLAYIIVKRFITLILAKIAVKKSSKIGIFVELFYSYDEDDESWYIKEHFGQAKSFLKFTYYGCCFVSGLTLLISCGLCNNNLVSAPFYPVFAVIIIGEMAFFIDGFEKDEEKSELVAHLDKSTHVVLYPLLRKPLKMLFGDKLSAEGTTINNGTSSGDAIEEILVDFEKNGGHIGKNYSLFIRKQMEKGLKPSADYISCGYDLSMGKSLLFNTPFYDKLNPYIFYAMNRNLITGGKILIVLGRHGTENDLLQWSEEGMKTVSNIPKLWKVSVLSNEKLKDDNLFDIGIISRSGVHDLGIHKNNLVFLQKVSFVFVVEPSLLVTTAQIGLNLLIKNCGKEKNITFCSVDRNCDGLVDTLSHVLMTDITEVSATEYPRGMSSYMYWTADSDYLQHRILPGISRYLGMGTEISMVALRNQVKKTIWYGGESFPIQDVRWIAKQYYYDLLEYAQLPKNQEAFDRYFQTSYNMCNERKSDYSFITVEDDRNNLFEMRRDFATIAEQQGFVNVISTEYMLREYMADNDALFTVDAKAIPYLTADYARSKRNVILSLCLMLCVDYVQESFLCRQMQILNIDTVDPVSEIWKEICSIFSQCNNIDKKGKPILAVTKPDETILYFEQDSTILFQRKYSIEKGEFDNVYSIENIEFSRIILDDLQNAVYIAEQESKDFYIGTELKGHVYQKYLPGQLFTLNGKYYEMVSTATDNRIMVRRASEHINGRLVYRQIRNYTINKLNNADGMGSLRTINDIDVHYQFADFSVETPGYWKMHSYNDFANADLIKLNGVPVRNYHHKCILKLDFSKLGELFTDSVRYTLTQLLNEAFVTLFAGNHHYILAVTPGCHEAPNTYNLKIIDDKDSMNKCIFLIEDSQLDIGLLITAERNINRIFQIISDYLNWNDKKIEDSKIKEKEETVNEITEEADESEKIDESEKFDEVKKVGFFKKVKNWILGLFKRKKKKDDNVSDDIKKENSTEDDEAAVSVNEDTEKENITHDENARIESENDNETVKKEKSITEEVDNDE